MWKKCEGDYRIIKFKGKFWRKIWKCGRKLLEISSNSKKIWVLHYYHYFNNIFSLLVPLSFNSYCETNNNLLNFRVRDDCPRLLINRELVGQNELLRALGLSTGSDFDPTQGTRDVFWEGMCDDGCQSLADKLGWGVSVFYFFFVRLCFKASSGSCTEWVKRVLKIFQPTFSFIWEVSQK